MLKFCLKAIIIVIVTELLMNRFVAPAITSKNDDLAMTGCFIGLAWMFFVGGVISYWWMKLKNMPVESIIAEDPFKNFQSMENPEEVWTSKQKGEIK